MNDPQQEIEGVIVRLCTANRTDQELALKRYFTSDASFVHPFCSVTNNRDKILRIYQWYKILSPQIEVSVDAVAYDQQQAILFANVSQTFKIWFIPAYAAKVKLTTVLHLVEVQKDDAAVMGLERLNKLFIKSQEDLYQTTEFVKFVLPWSIGTTIIQIWQYIATMLCVFGAAGYIFIASILSWIPALFIQRLPQREPERPAVSSERSTDLDNSEPSNTDGATADDKRRDSKRVEGDTDGHGNVVVESTIRKRSNVQSGKNEGVVDLERKSNLGQTK